MTSGGLARGPLAQEQLWARLGSQQDCEESPVSSGISSEPGGLLGASSALPALTWD